MLAVEAPLRAETAPNTRFGMKPRRGDGGRVPPCRASNNETRRTGSAGERDWPSSMSGWLSRITAGDATAGSQHT